MLEQAKILLPGGPESTQKSKRTFNLRTHSIPDTPQTLPELRLRCAQLLKRGRQVLELVVDLFLDLGELRRGEGVQIDYW